MNLVLNGSIIFKPVWKSGNAASNWHVRDDKVLRNWWKSLKWGFTQIWNGFSFFSAAVYKSSIIKPNWRKDAKITWFKIHDAAFSYIHSFSFKDCRIEPRSVLQYILDVLWGQPIKLAQVASTSELLENQRNHLVFIKIIPSHFCRASEASEIDCFKN